MKKFAVVPTPDATQTKLYVPAHEQGRLQHAAEYLKRENWDGKDFVMGDLARNFKASVKWINFVNRYYVRESLSESIIEQATDFFEAAQNAVDAAIDTAVPRLADVWCPELYDHLTSVMETLVEFEAAKATFEEQFPEPRPAGEVCADCGCRH